MFPVNLKKKFTKPPIPTIKPKPFNLNVQYELGAFTPRVKANNLQKKTIPLPEINLKQISTSFHNNYSQTPMHSNPNSKSKRKIIGNASSTCVSRHNTKNINNTKSKDKVYTIETSSSNKIHSIKIKRPPSGIYKRILPFNFNDYPKTSRTNSKEKNKVNNVNRIITENDYVHIHDLFRMKCHENNSNQRKKKENDYNSVKRSKGDNLIDNEILRYFKDEKIYDKETRNKSVNNVVTETKKVIRFWKAVLDASYPRIIVKQMKECSQTMNKKDNEINLY